MKNCRLVGYGRGPRFSSAAGVIAIALSACVVQTALAKPGGEPLVLDTQSGIHSGTGGTVLQTGPLSGPGMVQAPPLATMPELPQQEQPPIIVSPYVEWSGGQAAAQPPTGAPPRPSHPIPSYPGAGPGRHGGGAMPAVPYRPGAPQGTVSPFPLPPTRPPAQPL